MNPNQPQYQPPGGQPVPPPAPSAAGKAISFSLTDVIVAGAALLFLIFSLVRFESFDTGGFDVPDAHHNLWGLTTLGWWIGLADLILLATAAAALFWPRDKEYLGFKRSQVQVGVALFVFLDTAGLYISLPSGAHGFGGAFCVLFALIAAVAAVLGHLGLLQNAIALPTGGAKPATVYPQTNYQSGAAPAGGFQGQTMPAPGYGQQPPAAGGYPPPGGYPAPGAPQQYPPQQAPGSQPPPGNTIV